MQIYIEEKEVTLPTLLELFHQAQYESSINKNGDFMVLAETALVGIDVHTADNQRFIRFTSMYKMKEQVPQEQKLAFVNSLNNDVVLCRFSILDTDRSAMNVVYHLPFWGGISGYHVIAAFRLFVHVYANVPSVMDKDSLIDYGTYLQIAEPDKGGHQTH